MGWFIFPLICWLVCWLVSLVWLVWLVGWLVLFGLVWLDSCDLLVCCSVGLLVGLLFCLFFVG